MSSLKRMVKVREQEIHEPGVSAAKAVGGQEYGNTGG